MTSKGEETTMNENSKSALKTIGKTVNKIMGAVGKGAVKIIGDELKNQRQRTLVKNCFSEDRYKKIIALAKLKKEYPEGYEEVKKELGRK